MPILRDGFIFEQYAKAMAEGHPYRFNAEDSPSTGSTSHLYPAILALLYKLGAGGDALGTAAFFFGVVCYLFFLISFLKSAEKISPQAASWGALLTVLSGQTFISALGPTEMGLFMALTMGAFAAALHWRWKWSAFLLALASWTRPEGAILSFVLMIAPWIGRSDATSSRQRMSLAGLIGVVSFGGVLALNYALTGSAAFHSVMGKGLFRFYPLQGVLLRATKDFGAMIRDVFLGLGDKGRQFYLLPLAGGLLGLFGFCSRDWRSEKTARIEVWWIVSAFISVGLVALSGWQGLQYDRYLAWFLPIGFLYVAVGVRNFSIGLNLPRLEPALVIALAIYQIAGACYFAAEYADDCAEVASSVAFYKKVNALLPQGSRIGMTRGAGALYFMPDQRVVNVNGIVTPIFTHKHPIECNLEWMKHRPETRADYWLVPAPTNEESWIWSAVGEQLAAETPAFGGSDAQILYRAKWDTLTTATLPLSPALLKSVEGMKLMDSLDVGYIEDETRCGYSTFNRIPGSFSQPFAATRKIAGRSATEIGRLVLGSESFHVRVQPNQPLHVVFRVASEAVVPIYKTDGSNAPQDFTFASPLKLGVWIGGNEALQIETRFASSGEFTESTFIIPGKFITGPSLEVTIGGDHLSTAYWFYQ